MYNKIPPVLMVVSLTLGIGLTACSAKATATQPSVTQPTKTQSPVIQPTDTRAPQIQPTDTQASTNQPTSIPAPTSLPTNTQLPTPTSLDTPAPPDTATAAPASGIDGETLLNQRCTVCHSLSRVTTQHHTADQWNQIVSIMVRRGAKLTSDEQQVLVDYLAKTYGP